jgi:hypothetical protein
MTDTTIATGGPGTLVEHFYRELAEGRAAGALRLLASEPEARSLSRAAEAFEYAAAALQHVLTLVPENAEIAERLADQAGALVLMAARFEQSADLARSAARGAATSG